jgi:Protein of unknown function (DUF2550)
LIATLAVLGVDLIVVVVLLVAVLARRRWVNHRPGVFAGAIRVSAGEHDSLGSKWRRGYGRWVRDVFVWTKKPLLFRNELVATDRLAEVRAAHDGEIKRMGDDPAVIELVAGAAVIQIAVHRQVRDLALGPYGDRDGRGSADGAMPAVQTDLDRASPRRPKLPPHPRPRDLTKARANDWIVVGGAMPSL